MGREKQNRLKETDRKMKGVYALPAACFCEINSVSWLLLIPQSALEINATMGANVHRHIIPHSSSSASATKASQGSSVK